jgi:hypothetical protein
MTRSWVAALDGELAASWRLHPLGLVTLGYAVAQSLRHGLCLASVGFRRRFPAAGHVLDGAGLGLVGLLLLRWVLVVW